MSKKRRYRFLKFSYIYCQLIYDEVVYCFECAEELSRTVKITTALGHNYVDDACTRCGEITIALYSEGLGFTTIDDTACYVSGIGICNDNEIEYPLYKSVISIGEFAFSYCTALTSVIIPDVVTSIGDWAFYNCFKLTDVYYTGTEAEWKAVTIQWGNDPLNNATKHYNQTK